MTLLALAKYIATTEHVIKRHQLYGDLPYTHHLLDAVRVLYEFDVTDEEYLAAGWLHDVIEDCPPMTERRLRELVGPTVSTLVWAVTDAPGRNRKERHDTTYPKTAGIVGGVVVKLADRIANVRQTEKFSMYDAEYLGFRRDLLEAKYEPRHKDAVTAMWKELDKIFSVKGFFNAL